MNGTHTAAALLLALCTATALLPPAVAHETPPPYPQFEPNDDFSTATEIEPRTLHGLQPIKFTSGPYGPAVGATEMGWMHQRRDVDYYAVDLERGDALPVTLYHYGSDGNLRYTLEDGDHDRRPGRQLAANRLRADPERPGDPARRAHHHRAV